LSHFHQLNAKILHSLQRTVKLCLIAEDTYQDGAGSCLFNVQIQSCEGSYERVRHLTAYADLIREAPSAFGHDRAVAAWPMMATALIAMTSMAINELITDMPPPR
jgi:hypothetical protein